MDKRVRDTDMCESASQQIEAGEVEGGEPERGLDGNCLRENDPTEVVSREYDGSKKEEQGRGFSREQEQEEKPANAASNGKVFSREEISRENDGDYLFSRERK
jgi:hypothetical protein